MSNPTGDALATFAKAEAAHRAAALATLPHEAVAQTRNLLRHHLHTINREIRPPHQENSAP